MAHLFGTAEKPLIRYRRINTSSFYLTMRDGVNIAITLALPDELKRDEKIPALIIQTRYWRDIELRAPLKWLISSDLLGGGYKGFKPFFVKRGYALISVDVRGTGASGGIWPYPWHRQTLDDAHEIIDWIIAQPWSNGRVGGWGISYLGTTAELLLVIEHPAVKAVIPMFNHPDPYLDIAYPGGMFNERFIREWSQYDFELDQNKIPKEFGWISQLVARGVAPIDGDQDHKLLDEAIRAHAANTHIFENAQQFTFRDECVPPLNISPDDISMQQYVKETTHSKTAICGWGSWLDAGTADAVIRRFLSHDNCTQAVIGAWEHGGQMHASPYAPSAKRTSPALPDQWAEMISFFDRHLREHNSEKGDKVLYYFTIGEEAWKQTSVWPPEGITYAPWYLGKENILSLQMPPEEAEWDTYMLDYRASTGKYNRWWELGAIDSKPVLYSDRDKAYKHMLVYTTSPLEADLELTGYPLIVFYLSSTHPDIALFIYLEDVAPDGSVYYITEGILRSIHRKIANVGTPYSSLVPYHSFKQMDILPLVPGEVAEIRFSLLPTSVLLQKGHRIRLGIAGHDRDTFKRIPEDGNPTITMLRGGGQLSRIELPIKWQ